MFKRLTMMSCVVAAMAFGVLQADQQETKNVQYEQRELAILFDQFFEDLQEISPELATFLGRTKQYNCQWSDYSEEGFAYRLQLYKNYLDQLLSIDRETLAVDQQISYDLFQRLLKEGMEEYRFKCRYMAINQLYGAPLDAESLLSIMPKESREDYDAILSRLEAIPKLIDQILYLLAKGLEEGITPPQIPLRSVPQTLQNLISSNPEESVFFQQFKDFSTHFNQDERDLLVEQAATVIRERVNPAYNKLLNYFVTTYLPGCRQTIGMSDLPNGQEWYQYCVALETTTKLTPEEIHTLGLAEVDRIHNEMEAIAGTCGFEDSLRDFLDYLNTDSQFFYEDTESLLAGYRAIAHYIDEQLPQLFGKFPKLPYEVVPIPAHLEQSQIAAYYMRGSSDTRRPGRFYVNTYDLPTRAKWQMESLTLHEAVPGHHFQISIAQENLNLPEFRKCTGYTAYIEGWALYCEGLGKEIGLYRSPYSMFGRLIDEMWRAIRLVVDTGMHALGWTREESIAYFIQQTGVSEREAATEVDRYLVMPGQALAYKIGELSIKKWRQQAKAALGDAFDIRAFHDILLEQGALPLDICEQQINEWLKSEAVAEAMK